MFTCMSVHADVCPMTSIGTHPDSANSGASAIHDGFGQTFLATDTLISALTVWRVASQDSAWYIGMRPYFMGTDAQGTPDISQMLQEGPTLIIPEGDGVNPIEFRWTFDPPIVLPAPGKYAFFLFQDPCAAWFDVLASRSPGGSHYPDGEFWSTFRSPGCTPISGMSSVADADLTFKLEFCNGAVTPIDRRSWGGLKVIYR